MSYALLEKHRRRLSRFQHLDAIVGWDEATMMAPQGGPERGEALATLRGYLHELATLPMVGEWLEAASQDERNLDPWQRANLREMRREWRRETALEQGLVEAMALAESRSEQAWRRLRPANDFAGFLPLLREVVQRKREAAQALGERLGLPPYDALTDGFEPGLRTMRISALFSRLRAFLSPLVPRIVEQQRRETVESCQGPFGEDRQRWLGLELMRRLGFDFGRGRLDISHHPFCGGVPSDVRITTRYDRDDFTSSMMSVIHETGHARYEQNLPAPWLGQPVASARSMSIHEGQSLFFEMQLGRSRPFAEVLSPLLVQAFPEQPRGAFAAENLFRHLTRVKPGLIRVHADEVTYPCHIILRFELEKAMIEGKLEPDDLPAAWDAGMQDLLGLSTEGNHRDGCMQDVHWPAGLFGYFPAYTLGALTAAQLFQAAGHAIPELPEQIRRGELACLEDWLRSHVWSQGSFLSTDDLVVRATGKLLDTAAFEQHVQTRYLRGEP
jgi:carboxypeptidase Taq